jgi:hypothetical protein
MDSTEENVFLSGTKEGNRPGELTGVPAILLLAERGGA